ncbi:predicted protein [Aspergillus nidulans FGSC A4]|uniref:Uncharacterized protein n=1 Tax=Emericella nidulans (strain FGSC A4 / ATCC 38163 / CBS 112.46 / NRRL 194 / M139) TaxID=227321 RepID=Q5BAU1_EMENI|nr:hypothetical protein [Aspergillus nidulans FGSC A4]EAA64450.1 predicted protein [Aspergillus nidulans FGSC A4]CBF86639.1 TPA: conserved hypothetical protein [Aspergillus nidulans FGSC A4]|eukprot:XP_659943.1 predicted protein [Aspergillus nidulans FGSC A4]
MPEMSHQGSSLFWHNQDYKSLSKNGSERIPKPTKPSSATDSGPERWPPSARPPSHTVFTRRIQPYSIHGYSGIDRAVSTVATPPMRGPGASIIGRGPVTRLAEQGTSISVCMESEYVTLSRSSNKAWSQQRSPNPRALSQMIYAVRGLLQSWDIKS